MASRRPSARSIEIVRGAYRLEPEDSETVVARKLDEGLKGLGLRFPGKISALLLNMLGLKAPEGALASPGRRSIGLRTRELLQTLVQARGRLTPLILVFEDLHWLDSASEDLLAKTVAMDKLRLLILHTRRPEYDPPWAGRSRAWRAYRWSRYRLGKLRRSLRRGSASTHCPRRWQS